MLKIEIKSNKSTKWESTARSAAHDAAKHCNTFDEFIRYFESVLKDRKRDSVGHISDSYKARRSKIEDGIPHKVLVLHMPAAGKIRVIAEITEDKIGLHYPIGLINDAITDKEAAKKND